MHLVFEGPCGPISDQSVTGHFLAGSIHIYTQIVRDELLRNASSVEDIESPIIWIQFWRDSDRINRESYRKIVNIKLKDLYNEYLSVKPTECSYDTLINDLDLHHKLATSILPTLLFADSNINTLSEQILEMQKIISSSSSAETTLRDELANLEILLRERTLELSEVRAEFENLVNESSKLTVKCQESEDIIKRIKAEKDTISQRERFTASELTSTREQLAELSSQIDTLLELNSKASQTNISIMEERKSILSNLTNAEKRIEELEASINSEDERTQAKLQESEKKFNEINEREKAHLKSIDEIRIKYQEAEEKIISLKNQIKETQINLENERSLAVKREMELRKELRLAQDSSESLRTENMGMALRIAKIVEEVEISRKQHEEERESQKNAYQLLQNTLNENERSLTRREEERKSLLKRMEELARTNQALLSEARRVELEASEKISANEKKVTQISQEANQRVEKANQEVQDLQLKVKELRESHDNLSNELNQAKSTISLNEDKFKELDQQIQNNSRSYKEILLERDASMSKLADLRLKLEQLKKEHKSELNDVIERNQSELNNLQESNKNLTLEYNKLRDSSEREIQQLRSSLDETQRIIEQEKESNKVINYRRAELEKESEQNKVKITELNDSITQLNNNITSHSNRINQLTAERDKLASDLSELRQLKLDLSNKLKEELDKAKNDYSQLKSKTEDERLILLKEFEDFKATISKERQERQSALEKLKRDSQAERDRLLSEVTQLRDKLKSSEEKNTLLNRELDHTRGLATQQTQRINDLLAQNKTAESRIAVFEGRIREIEQLRISDQNVRLKEVNEFNSTLRDLKEQKLKAEAVAEALKQESNEIVQSNKINQLRLTEEIANLKEQLEFSREKIKSFTDLAADKAKLIMRVTKLTSESNQAWETVRELNETSTRVKSEYEQQINKLKSELEGALLELDKLRTQSNNSVLSDSPIEHPPLLKLQEERDRIKEQLLTAEAKLRAADASITEKERFITLLQAQKDAADNKISLLGSEIEELKSKTYSSKASLESHHDEEVASVSNKGRKLVIRYTPRDPFSLLVTYSLSDHPDTARISFTIIAAEHAHKLSSSLRRIYKNRAEYFLQRYFGDIVANPNKLSSEENVLPDGFWKLLNKDNVTVIEVANLEYERTEGQTVLALEKYIKKLEEQGLNVLASNQ